MGDRDVAQEVVVCLCCGGRGGWWSGQTRTSCDRCSGTGWEPSLTIARLLEDQT